MTGRGPGGAAAPGDDGRRRDGGRLAGARRITDGPAAASPGDRAGRTTATRTVTVDGVELRRGSRVRLRPAGGADVFDLALAGQLAEVDAVEEDLDGRTHVAVVVEGDPGRDLGAPGQMGHRFFFSPDELDPSPGPAFPPPDPFGPGFHPGAGSAGQDGNDRTDRPDLTGRHGGGGTARTGPGTRILVAGIGNVFLADDGFGPAVVAALRRRDLPPGVLVVDFGIRGMDLAYRLVDGFDVVLFVDAFPHGAPPGSLSLVEPDLPDLRAAGPMPEGHAMDPVRVLALARRLAEGPLPRVLVVGCEPEVRMAGDEPDVVVGLSEPVGAAVERAVPFVESILAELLADPSAALEDRPAGQDDRSVGQDDRSVASDGRYAAEAGGPVGEEVGSR